MIHKQYYIEMYQHPINIYPIIQCISLKMVCLLNNNSYG